MYIFKYESLVKAKLYMTTREFNILNYLSANKHVAYQCDMADITGNANVKKTVVDGLNKFKDNNILDFSYKNGTIEYEILHKGDRYIQYDHRVWNDIFMGRVAEIQKLCMFGGITTHIISLQELSEIFKMSSSTIIEYIRRNQLNALKPNGRVVEGIRLEWDIKHNIDIEVPKEKKLTFNNNGEMRQLTSDDFTWE